MNRREIKKQVLDKIIELQELYPILKKHIIIDKTNSPTNYIIPDLFLPIKKGRCNGIYLKFSYKKPTMNDFKKSDIDFMESNRYKFYFCKTAEIAISKLQRYIAY